MKSRKNAASPIMVSVPLKDVSCPPPPPPPASEGAEPSDSRHCHRLLLR